MPIRTGESGASEQQLGYLEMVRSGDLPDRQLVEILTMLARDDDILAGREPLHPDWLAIYADLQRSTRQYLPPSRFRRLDEFFAAARPFDPQVATIDPASTKLAFLLGAGASKPEPSGIPTVQELLPDLLSRARRLDREDVTRLADFCERSRISNIEDLLTAAQLAEFCSRNPAMLRLVDFLLFRQLEPEEPHAGRRRFSPVDLSSVAFLQDTLQVLFGLLSSRMLPAKPNTAHNAITEFIRIQGAAAVVTTNYDCCIDQALGQEARDFSYCIDFANVKAVPESTAGLVPLIKLHGSLSWFYCETCQKVHLIDFDRTVDDFLNDRGSYPVIGVCRDCGGQRRGLLVPPLAMKFDVAPPLNPLLERAQQAFNAAETIVVVGFSFADADLYISRMVSKAMQASETRRLVIFDPEHAVVNRVRRQFSARIPRFHANSRILWVPGDCADSIPKFLSGDFFNAEETPRKDSRGETPGA